MPSIDDIRFIPESNGASVGFIRLDGDESESLYLSGPGLTGRYVDGPTDLLIEKDRHGVLKATHVPHGTAEARWTPERDYTVATAIEADTARRRDDLQERIEALRSAVEDVEGLADVIAMIEADDNTSANVGTYCREARYAIGALESALDDDRYALIEKRDDLG